MRRYLRTAWHVSPGAYVARRLTRRRAERRYKAAVQRAAKWVELSAHARVLLDSDPRITAVVYDSLSLIYQPTKCTRPPHDGPCNGWPCDHRLAEMERRAYPLHEYPAYIEEAFGAPEPARILYRCFAPYSDALAGRPCHCSRKAQVPCGPLCGDTVCFECRRGGEFPCGPACDGAAGCTRYLACDICGKPLGGGPLDHLAEEDRAACAALRLDAEEAKDVNPHSTDQKETQ